MLLLKHGSMWLVMFLLLGVRNSDCRDIPSAKEEKTGVQEVQDSGGGTTAGLLQYQADSGGYKNNSEPASHQDNESDVEWQSTEAVITTTTDFPDLTKSDQLVESSTHQEEMTFGEEFETEDKIKKTTQLEEEHTERISTEREVASGSSVYEVIADDSDDTEGLNSSTQSDFPHDIGTEESNHDGYNDDAILYFESKRFKGLKKKNQSNKSRLTSNSINSPNTPSKERIQITSYVADISEVDEKDLKHLDIEEKRTSKPPPRDATTISTFFIAPRETVSRRTPVRIRKKIIKPVRLGYRKKQTSTVPPETQPLFNQKVTLVDPPSSLFNENEGSIEEAAVTTTEKFNIYHEKIIDHIDLPMDGKKYLPLPPVNSVPYVQTPHIPYSGQFPLPVTNIVGKIPEQYFVDDDLKYKIKDFKAVLPTVSIPQVSFQDQPTQTENSVTPISFLFSQSIANEYRPSSKHANFVTSKGQQQLNVFGNQQVNEFDSLHADIEGSLSEETKENDPKLHFEETNRAEDGLTSSDTILAPIQAAVSLSNHVQQEGKKKPATNTIIEQQEIRVEPVLKTTIEIQKSIPFEIKEIKHEFNQIPNFNQEHEKTSEPLYRQQIPQQNDFIQQVALAYHKLSNNGDYQTNLQIPPANIHPTQPQNYVYFYRNRLPHHALYLFPFQTQNKGVNDFNKGNVGNVGPYIMQQSYKNLGYDHYSRIPQYQNNLKYQGVYPSLTRAPLTYSNLYDLSAPLIYQPNVPSVSQGYHKSQIHLRPPIGLEHNSNQHPSLIRTHFEENNGASIEEEVDSSSTEESVETSDDLKPGSEIQIQESKQEVLSEVATEQPHHIEGHTSPPFSLLSHTQAPLQHVTEPHRIPNNQPYPYGYSFVYPISTTEFRSQNPYLNYYRRGKAPPFRPSHPMYTSQYPPHTYLVATTLPERDLHARSINHKKLCIEYGGFKPPMVPSIQIDEEFEKEAQDKSSNDE